MADTLLESYRNLWRICAFYEEMIFLENHCSRHQPDNMAELMTGVLNNVRKTMCHIEITLGAIPSVPSTGNSRDVLPEEVKNIRVVCLGDNYNDSERYEMEYRIISATVKYARGLQIYFSNSDNSLR